MTKIWLVSYFNQHKRGSRPLFVETVISPLLLLNLPELGAAFSLSVMTTPGIRSTAPFTRSLFYTWPTGNAQPASHLSIPASLHNISLCVCRQWTPVCFISPSSQLYWSVHSYTNSDPFSDCVSNQTLILVWSMLLFCTLGRHKLEYVYVCFSCKWSVIIRLMWNQWPQILNGGHSQSGYTFSYQWKFCTFSSL